MIYKPGKCKCCGKNYLIVNWLKGREYSFCGVDHVEKYIIAGFTPNNANML